MQTLEGDKYTLMELKWAVDRYHREFDGSEPSFRTFRRWRQALKIQKDCSGLYWHSDLELIKDAIRRMSQGQTLEQIAYMQEEQINAAC